ncbi:MAG TPA: hypothetical protein VJZ00_25980 [Thermoanaerobaculia bacterium]|nr:hypothetical protein [Thermoanaerobaculia bacterium]
MWIVLTAASSLLLGWELCARVWRGDDLRSCERAAFAAIVASALWLGTAWLLALVHWLTRPMLIARTLLFALAAIVVLLRRARIERWRERLDQQVDATTLKRWLLPLVPVVLWVFFVAWRGLLLPPLSHDALSYHMPKALFFARAAGYTDLADVRFLVTARPSNYELLLAESIVMSGNDDTTEWISVLMYLGFIIAAAAMAQRWSDGDRASTMIVALLTAASPVVLLHSGAHKNDVMTAFFVVAGLVAAGRWFATRERASLVICAAAFALGIGTKAHAFLVPLFLLPFIAWHARRELKRLAVPALAAIVFFFALGAWEEPAAVLKHAETPATASAGQKTPGYGAWRNVWRGAYVLLAAPFSTDSYELSVPWSKGTWYWRRYEIYF